MEISQYQIISSSRSLYKVNYLLPISREREIVLSVEELNAWLRQSWLRNRIIGYERIGDGRNVEA